MVFLLNDGSNSTLEASLNLSPTVDSLGLTDQQVNDIVSSLDWQGNN
jgi:hypothetical protein